MNLFLVEDERWALAELVELFGVYMPEHNVYAFDNAEDVLAAAGSVQPHLVLTDINMPGGMDGLELIGELNRIGPAFKAIILSVHDQFAYAQQGMKLGVIDYLLKPVRKEVLYQVVDKAIRKFELDSKRQEERKIWAVAQMLNASAVPEDETTTEIYNGKYAVTILLIGNPEPDKGWNETGITNEEIANRVRSAPEIKRPIHCVSMDSQRKAVLVPVDDSRAIEGIRTALGELFNGLVRQGLKLHMAYTFKNEREDVHQCFVWLNKRVEEQMNFGCATFISPDKDVPSADLITVWEKVRVLQSHLKQGDLLGSREVIARIVQDLQSKDVTVKQLSLFVSDLFYSLKYNLQSMSKPEIGMSKLQEDIKALQRLAGYGELYEWLVDNVFGLLTGPELKEIKPKGLIPFMRNWIHAGYQHELSIKQFAADNHVSLGYLSRLFKAQTGYTFSDYVMQHRIEKAKELLAEGRTRLSDISGLVGYEDAKHFSQLFKRIVGIPPNMYAKRMNPKP